MQSFFLNKQSSKNSSTKSFKWAGWDIHNNSKYEGGFSCWYCLNLFINHKCQHIRLDWLPKKYGLSIHLSFEVRFELSRNKKR